MPDRGDPLARRALNGERWAAGFAVGRIHTSSSRQMPERSSDVWPRAVDFQFAGARNVFMRVGGGRIRLYDQPPRVLRQATVDHLGVQTDELETVVQRLGGLGVSLIATQRKRAGPTRWPRDPTACSS